MYKNMTHKKIIFLNSYKKIEIELFQDCYKL